MKARVAAEDAGDADYDDYTGGKTAFFWEWQHAWAGLAGAQAVGRARVSSLWDR
jgi:hypothetical protein